MMLITCPTVETAYSLLNLNKMQKKKIVLLFFNLQKNVFKDNGSYFLVSGAKRRAQVASELFRARQKEKEPKRNCSL